MKKVLNLCQDTREMYILNAEGTPKRIARNMWIHMFHRKVKDEDEIGNKKIKLVRRVDYLKYKEITLKEYEEITGLSFVEGIGWRKRPATKAQAIVETVKEPAKVPPVPFDRTDPPENMIMEADKPKAQPRTNRKRKR